MVPTSSSAPGRNSSVTTSARRPRPRLRRPQERKPDAPGDRRQGQRDPASRWQRFAWRLCPRGRQTAGSFPVHPPIRSKTFRVLRTGGTSRPHRSGRHLRQTGRGKGLPQAGNYPKALAAEISADGKQFLVSYDAPPRIYDAAGGKEVVAFDNKTGQVRYGSVSQRQPVCGFPSTAMRCCECGMSRPANSFSRSTCRRAAHYVALSADGKLAATWCNAPDVVQVCASKKVEQWPPRTSRKAW